jgi:hypothetical protein
MRNTDMSRPNVFGIRANVMKPFSREVGQWSRRTDFVL